MSKRTFDDSTGLSSEAEERLRKRWVDDCDQQAVDMRQKYLELEIQNSELKKQLDEISEINVKLENANTYFSELFHLAPVGYFRVTRDGTIASTNKTGEKLLGVRPDRLSGVRIGFLVAEHHRQGFDNFLDQVFNSDSHTEYSWEIELDAAIEPKTLQLSASGQEAMSVFDKNLHSIDLLVTDVVMPNTDGVELAQILAKKKPDLGVLFMSGYIAEEASRDQIQKRKGHFLQKPFSPIDLVRCVRRILDS